MKIKISFLLPVLLLVACSEPGLRTVIMPDDPNIAYIGRFHENSEGGQVFMYSGCAIRTVFTGTSVDLIMKDDSLRNMFTVIIDDSLLVLTADRADSTYRLAENLPDTKHNLEIIRRTEWHGGNTTFLVLKLDKGGKTYPPELKERKIEFIGDSYTCGYGNEGKSREEHFTYKTENNYLTFGAITARAVNAEYLAVCRSGIGIVQGYGGGREFTMPGYYDEIISDSTISWDYSKYHPQLVVIDLAGNDLSAPLDSAEFVNAYVTFLKRIRQNYAEASIICIAGPSSPGEEWTTWQNLIHAVVDQFGETDRAVHYFEFTPFEPNGSDWHPNVEEHQRMADELVPFVKDLMKW
ncbi:MAG: hypothetical protein JW830_13775 [Bacteroidales bacterium]|nr:hypothetical protein [Bacteroidales bacterium]